MGCSNSKKVHISNENMSKNESLQKQHQLPVKSPTVASIDDTKDSNETNLFQRAKSAVFVNGTTSPPMEREISDHLFFHQHQPKAALKKGVSTNDLADHAIIHKKAHINSSFCIDNAHNHEDTSKSPHNGAYFQALAGEIKSTGSGKSFSLQMGQIMSKYVFYALTWFYVIFVVGSPEITAL